MASQRVLTDTIAQEQKNALDKSIGYELLNLAINRSRHTSNVIAGIYSEVTTRPAVGTPDSFRHPLTEETWDGVGIDKDSFRRKLDVMYELVAACFQGKAHVAQCPEGVSRAIDALEQPFHSLSKNRYSVVARRLGSRPI
ncbi:uncharacterized protein JCM6883_004405 [Sporobolomyces salmoneus]|uniref:uncharacterized protein n=1 Tax=Sporobolomyces salmoneus TaxID=183962 RepID=UPI0031763335